MIFAVSMTFIDQTIVSIAVPEIQRELGLSATGVQWAVNAYLLSLAAFFAYGGRLADTVGHRKMAVIGVIIFAAASAMCGLTPKGSLAEAWIVTFRAVQGFGGALLFPAALAIVVQTFPLRERGKALAMFFGIAGGLTAVGPILGGYLTQWTWRAIFWVNIPVAVIALVLIAVSRADDRRTGRPGWTTGAWPSSWPGSASASSGSSRRPSGAGAIRPSGCASPPGVALLVVFVLRRAAHRGAADAGAHLRGSGRSWSRTWCSASPCWRSSPCSSSPASTPRSPWPSRHRRPGSSSSTSSSASWSRPRSAAACSTGAGPSGRS